MRFEKVVIAGLGLVLTQACTSGPSPEGTPPTPPTVPNAASTTTPPATDVAAAPQQPETPRPVQSDSLEITLREAQIFHPWSKSRAIQSGSDPSRASTGYPTDYFGVGVVLEAVNEGPKVLTDVDFEASITFHGEQGGKTCNLSGQAARWGGTPWWSWSPVTTAWQAVRDEDVPEGVWRPGEKLRIVLRDDKCASWYLLDTKPTSIDVAAMVQARGVYDQGTMSSPVTKASIPADVLRLQGVKVPGMDSAFVSGDVLIGIREGRAVVDTLHGVGLSAADAPWEDLPPVSPGVNASVEELAMSVSAVKLRHWADGQGIPVGDRNLEIEAKLSLDAAHLDARLRAPLDAARSAATASGEALAAAKLGVTQAESSGDPVALASARQALQSSDADERAKKAALAKAEQVYASGVGSERARLVAALPCDRIDLVTNRRTVTAANRGEAAAACQALRKDGAEVTIVLRYDIGRYEVPVALSHIISGKPSAAPIASKALSTFDLR